MTTGLIIFARMGSKRLPGKALRAVGGRPLLAWVIERARRVGEAGPIIVATSEHAADDAIADRAVRQGAVVFRGALDDVADRALACADRYGLTRFARICGDSPFFEPAMVEQLIAQHSSLELDLATNVFPRTFPPGASVEIIATEALRRAVTASKDPWEREHITQHLYRHPERFSIRNFAAPDDRYAGVALAVDTEQDLERSRWIVARLGDATATAGLDELAALARAWAERGDHQRAPVNRLQRATSVNRP